MLVSHPTVMGVMFALESPEVYRTDPRTHEDDGDETDVDGQPGDGESRQLLGRGEDEEKVGDQLKREDDEDADVQVGRFASRLDPCRQVAEKSSVKT